MNEQYLEHFNPYHDPKDGKFTSKNGAHSSGHVTTRKPSSSAESIIEKAKNAIVNRKDVSISSIREKYKNNPRKRDKKEVAYYKRIMKTKDNKLTDAQLRDKKARTELLNSVKSTPVSSLDGSKAVELGKRFVNHAFQEVIVPSATTAGRNYLTNKITKELNRWENNREAEKKKEASKK